MYQFTSFDAGEFDAAIEAKDYRKIKSYIVSAIRNNPCFTKAPGQNASETKLAIEILNERLKEIFVDYEVLEGEHPFNKEESATWDWEYFIRQTFLLEENFSMTRIGNLKKIGKKISNFQRPQEQMVRRKQSRRTEMQVAVQDSGSKNRRLIRISIFVLAILVGIMAIMMMKYIVILVTILMAI